MKLLSILTLSFLLFSCAQDRSEETRGCRVFHVVQRQKNEWFFTPKPPQWQGLPTYFWQTNPAGEHPRITKEFFRCRGSQLNPIRIVSSGKNSSISYQDCGGAESHSLPLRDGKEFVYPVLLEILHYIQQKTGNRVVITSGHRCPEHNSYVDASAANRTSKHQIAAAVCFYVQGFETDPEKVYQLIQDYYCEHPKWGSQPAFTSFSKSSHSGMCNKEILVKIYEEHEGRDFDNRHPYPYLQIQVRWDRESKAAVQYSWRTAHRNYHRF